MSDFNSDSSTKSTDVLYDVAVVGLGAHGSSIAGHLAARNVKVLGLEKFAPAHSQGSSHGRSRIFRTAYFEDPIYVPLLVRSLVLWKELCAREKAFLEQNGECGSEELLRMTGALMIGAAADIAGADDDDRDGITLSSENTAKKSVLAGTLASIRKYKLEHEVLSAAEVKARFPCFNLNESEVAIYEKDAAVLIPEMCIIAYLRMAADYGAELRYHESMETYSMLEDGTYNIQSSTGCTYRCKKLVLSVGAWAPQLYGNVLATDEASLNLPPLYLERRVLYWFNTANNTAFQEIPVYIWQTASEGSFYGFPQQSGFPSGIKVAMHGMEQQCIFTTPEEIERTVTTEEVQVMKKQMVDRIPLLAEGILSHTVTCMYTCTPDWHFLLDWHPEHAANKGVLLVSPCSGHGFKFSSVIGEICADLVLNGKTDNFDISLFKRR